MSKAKQEIRFGVVGLGMMGREFGSAVARWCHLLDLDFKPVITAICSRRETSFAWFDEHFESVRLRTTEYRDLLDSGAVDVVYVAVPHYLHQQMYVDVIRSGKHLLGEKPFGMDLAASQSILRALDENPDVFAACVTQFAFYPAARRVMQAVTDGRLGTIIEAEVSFLHSSDLNPNKPINWKRQVVTCGEYGCMGDLGMHILHIPLRAGWRVERVSAILSKIMRQRPDGKGGMAVCDTWDNATLSCLASAGEQTFPLLVRTHRIAPGESNTWSIRVTGTRRSVEYSTRYPKTLRFLDYEPGGEQAWASLDVGYETAYPTISPVAMEFGFSDGLLQMWAAFCDELAHGRAGMKQPFYCATPLEAHQQHRIFTAALESQRSGQSVTVETVG